MKRALIGSLVLWCAVTGAAQAQTRVVVFDFEGPKDAVQIRKAVVDILEDNAVEVVSTKTALAQARRSGAELDTESGRVRVGKKLRLTAFVEGRVERGRRGAIRVNLAVYGARDGLVAGQMSASAPKKKVAGELKATLWDQLGGAVRGETESARSEPEPLAEEAPPPPPQRQRQQPVQRQPVQREDEDEEEVAQAEPPEEETEEAPGEEKESKPSAATKVNALDINVGARFGTRDYVYNDPLPGLRKYGMRLSPNLRLAVRWYPVAHFEDGALANIGLDVRGEMLVGVTSKTRAGQKFETSAHSLGVGVRGRLPFRTFELGALLGYGIHSFSLTGTSKADPDVPDASYGFIRAGLDARVSLSEPQDLPGIYLSVQAAYLLALSHGEIEDQSWFPHTSGDGIEAEFAVGIAISQVISLETAFALQRYFMTFDPLPNDRSVRDEARVAGGAVDQYLSGRLAMVIRL
jgi:hypothetical protein